MRREAGVRLPVRRHSDSFAGNCHGSGRTGEHNRQKRKRLGGCCSSRPYCGEAISGMIEGIITAAVAMMDTGYLGPG